VARIALPRPKLSVKALLMLVVACAAVFLVIRATGESRPVGRWARQLSRGEAGARREAAAELIIAEPRDARVAIGALIGGLADADAEVRAQSALSLGFLIGRSGGVSARRNGGAALSSRLADDPLRDRATTALVRGLDDPSPLVRSLSAKALGGFAPAPAVAVGRLVAMLKGDAAEEARVAAAGALVSDEVGDKAVVDALIAAMKADKSPEVRLISAASLAPIAGYEPVFLAFVGAMGDADGRLRAAVEGGLRRVKLPHPSGIAALLAILERTDLPESTTDLAAWLLGGIGPEAARAAPGLLAASRRLKEPPEQDLGLRATLCRALYSVAPESAEFRAALDELIAILGETPASWRQYSTAILLGEFGKAAEPALPALRTAAVEWDKEYAGYAGKAATAIELGVEGVEP